MNKNRQWLLSTLLLCFLVLNSEASSTSSDPLPFDSDLVAHWALDDGKGSGVAIDALKENPLQLQNMDVTTSWGAGRIGGALSISGDDRVMNNAVTPALKPTHVTLSGWFKVKHGNRQWIAAQADNYGLFLNNTDQIVFYIHHEDDWEMVTAEHQQFSDNQWHHVAGTYDGKIMKVFFDGREVALKNETRHIAYTTGNQFTIGSMNGGRVFSGDIDDVRVYHRALSTDEIALLVNVKKLSEKIVKPSSANVSKAVTQAPTKPVIQKCGTGQEPHYYVSPTGNNKSDGSHASPWKTLQYAANQLKCGSLHIMAGVYKEHVTFSHSGTAESYIKILGQKGAIIDGRFGYDNKSKGLLTIENASYIILDGVTVRNALTHGIMYKGKGKYIFIRNCITEHTRGAGIFIYGEWPFTGYHISHVSVEHNEVHWPQEGRFDGNNIWQEDITLLGGIENFDVSYNYVNAYDSVRYSGGPIGIDVKAGVKNGVVHHNTVENIPSNGIYVDAGEAEAINIKVYQNIVRNVTGFGIPIAGESGGKLDNIEVFNNLIDTSGYSGIAFSDYSPKEKQPKYPLKPRTNIKIYNNTVYNGGAKSGWGWGIMTETQFGGEIYNNVISNSKPSAMKLGHIDTTGVSHNCFQKNPKQSIANSGSNAVIGAVNFVNASQGDFTLQSSSPCIDSGLTKGAPLSDLNGEKRPKGQGVDMGAYEF